MIETRGNTTMFNLKLHIILYISIVNELLTMYVAFSA